MGRLTRKIYNWGVRKRNVFLEDRAMRKVVEAKAKAEAREAYFHQYEASRTGKLVEEARHKAFRKARGVPRDLGKVARRVPSPSEMFDLFAGSPTGKKRRKKKRIVIYA